MGIDGRHIPVMVDRCVALLAPALERDGAVALDGTCGLGGHSEAILEACPRATVVGIDRDGEALARATSRLARFGDRFRAHRAEFDDVGGALGVAGATRADAVLLDLGVSSMQIDEPTRGFSYATDAPLDMRMDRDGPETAAEILANASEGELTRILREYGEERYAARIARAVVRRRIEAPVERSADLVALVRGAIPSAARQEGGNPAKRTFQALRIAVNDELAILDRALPAAISALAVGGRMAVLSYHSLEDRRTKRAFAHGAEVRAPVGMPVVRDADAPYLRLLTRGAERPSDDEIARNPRSKPARLRAIERIRETPLERSAA